jgi:hypothetical protein
MKRYTLMIAFGAIGLVLLAASAHRLTAETVPSGGDGCYYNLWNCSYNGNGYWSGCTPGYPQGWISTETANVICTTYHINS